MQPRRVAAKAAAQRMAGLLRERAGARIGFATRLERALSQRTRVEVVTTGVLLRRLQTVRMHACCSSLGIYVQRPALPPQSANKHAPKCPRRVFEPCAGFPEMRSLELHGEARRVLPVQDRSLPGVAAVLLDEFHERGWDADLALALCTLCRGTARPDLRRACYFTCFFKATIPHMFGRFLPCGHHLHIMSSKGLACRAAAVSRVAWEEIDGGVADMWLAGWW